MAITTEIVHRFLEEKLQMSDWRSKLKTDKLKFLTEIVAVHSCKIYYQNASWAAIPIANRKMPTVSEVIHHGIESAGSTCIHLNYFIMLILENLGFDVFVVGAESPLWDIRRSHLVTIVRFKEADQLYLIDLGFGRPFLEPIPLHDLPFMGRAGGYDFEFRFNPENQKYERFSHGGCALKGKFDADTPGKVDYSFDLTALNFDDFSECFKSVFVGSAPFLEGLFLFRLTRFKSPRDFDYVACRNIVMIKGSADTYEETTFESYESMLPEMRKNFPNLNWTEINAAILHYNQARLSKIQDKA